MDQLDHFHTKHRMLEDLVYGVGWSSCERFTSHIPSSLVCLVDCRLSATHLVAHCLDGHNSSEKAAAWLEGRLPAGWGRSCGDRSQKLVCSLAGVDLVDLRSYAHSWAAEWLGSRRWRSSVVPEEKGGGRSPAMTKSAIIIGSPDQIMEMISHLGQLQPEPWWWRVCCLLCIQPFKIPFVGLQMVSVH